MNCEGIKRKNSKDSRNCQQSSIRLVTDNENTHTGDNFLQFLEKKQKLEMLENTVLSCTERDISIWSTVTKKACSKDMKKTGGTEDKQLCPVVLVSSVT